MDGVLDMEGVLDVMFELFDKYENIETVKKREYVFVCADRGVEDMLEKSPWSTLLNKMQLYTNPQDLDEYLYKLYNDNEFNNTIFRVIILNVVNKIPEKYMSVIVNAFKRGDDNKALEKKEKDLSKYYENPNKILIAVNKKFNFNSFIYHNNIEKVDVYNSNGIKMGFYCVVV